jgi:transketolase
VAARRATAPDPIRPGPGVFLSRPPTKAERLSGRIRRIVIEQSRRANVGHIGSSLSIADIVGTLYADVMRSEGPEDPARERIVLSKGHACLAAYAALYESGIISDEELDTFCGEGSRLGTHPEHILRGIDFSTGSLGHGLSIATGSALGARIAGEPRRTFVVMSDAECNEGSVWEAAMFAAHHRLGRLIAIVDVNGQQALGYTRDVLDLSPLKARWDAFGWDAHEVDGHDHRAMAALIDDFEAPDDRPHVVLARTTFGRGVSYMESEIRWHYMPMNAEQYDAALSELASSELLLAEREMAQ